MRRFSATTLLGASEADHWARLAGLSPDLVSQVVVLGVCVAKFWGVLVRRCRLVWLWASVWWSVGLACGAVIMEYVGVQWFWC